jgi:hypothetical protein
MFQGRRASGAEPSVTVPGSSLVNWLKEESTSLKRKQQYYWMLRILLRLEAIDSSISTTSILDGSPQVPWH